MSLSFSERLLCQSAFAQLQSIPDRFVFQVSRQLGCSIRRCHPGRRIRKYIIVCNATLVNFRCFHCCCTGRRVHLHAVHDADFWPCTSTSGGKSACCDQALAVQDLFWGEDLRKLTSLVLLPGSDALLCLLLFATLFFILSCIHFLSFTRRFYKLVYHF